jgi:hypothetical protein
MTSTRRNLRRAVALLGLTGAFAVISPDRRAGPGTRRKGATMKASTRWRGAATLLTLVGAVFFAGGMVAPASANGPTLSQLTDAGWTCQTAAAAPRIICSNPAQGFPSTPPDPSGRPSYNFIVFGLDGTFRGTSHLIRADLYRGQPCPSGWFFVAAAGYYRCDHF